MGLLRSIAARFLRFGNFASTSDKPGDPRHDLGRRGEELAARELRRQGYRVLYRNFRPDAFSHKGGEIDLVCRDAKVLVFVEVKTRQSLSHGDPIEAITPAQKQRITDGAFTWLRLLGYPPIHFRFDVVEVLIRGKAASVCVVKDAFTLPHNVRYPATPEVI